MRRTLARAVVVSWTALQIVRCGEGPSPTSPPVLESAQPQLALSDASALHTAALSGRILDAVSGAPVAGARVAIPERAEAVTDVQGRFSIPVQTSVVPLTVEASGYLRRDTRARAGEGATTLVEIDVVPEEGRFDLDFFDHVFRDLGEDGTHPWTSEPSFEILSRVFDCIELDFQGYCELYEATEQTAPEQFVNLAREVISADTAAFTGGVLTGENVFVVPVEPGTRFRRRDAWVRDKVRFLLLQLPNDFSWATWWYYSGAGDMYSGLININKRHKALRRVYSHELAHTLGYGHPRGGHEVPLPSIMRYTDGDGPEANDRFHGRLLYRRPPGSRSPDVDPPEFLLNGLRDAPAPAGELVEVNAR